MGKKRWIARLTAILLMVMTGAAQAQVYLSPPPEGIAPLLTWTVLDVDEGDAMLLESGGKTLLVDGGPWAFRDRLRLRLAELGHLHLDTVLSTHDHDDHIDGLYSLFCSGFTAGEYLHGYSDRALQQKERANRTAQAAADGGASIRRAVHGETLTLGSCRVQVYQCIAIDNTNARSLVLRVTCGGTALLLCADITGAAQHWLLDNLPPEMLRADVIKLPHHGITPTVTDFLDAVDPAAMIVTNRPDRIQPGSQSQLDYRALLVLFSGLGEVQGVTDGQDWYFWQAER